ncbi:MAG: ADP-ribosyl-[dinitrogen reductase] hydrolase [Azoarcus sp.]|jgi:ADP-ribosyl-[dinitrogen reductase] hydrolase|nr:ADP-ribosyl-[dinitrogen reductase] hydrolase [Azoarcus sp.]
MLCTGTLTGTHAGRSGGCPPLPEIVPATSPARALEDRAIGAYLGLAIGDALGATVEFLTPREIRHAFARHGGAHTEITGGGWLRLKRGQVTDDTGMALALGEALLTGGGKLEALAAAHAFDAWMRSKPIDIGNTVRRNLLRFRATGETAAPPSEHDAGNGAVMRTLPVALATLGHGDAGAAAFKAQAHVTHNNPLSDAGGLCLLDLLHAALARRPWPELLARARALEAAHKEYAWSAAQRHENPSGYIAHTLIAVFQAFFTASSFEGCLVDVINRGGDADTTGAIAGALAGAWYGMETIPPRWTKALDPAIAQRCREQAIKLCAFARAP